MKPLTYDDRDNLYLDILAYFANNTNANLTMAEEDDFSDFFDEIMEPYTTGDFGNVN